MANFSNERYRSESQRHHFPVKLRDELREQICVRYALGESIASIHAWITESKGIDCSYQAIWALVHRKRWLRFINTITRAELEDSNYSLLFHRLYEEKKRYWDKMEEGYWDILKTAIDQNPTQADGFIRAAKVLRGLKGEKELTGVWRLKSTQSERKP